MLTVIFPELPRGEFLDAEDIIWNVLTVSAGPLGNHKLTGISKIVKTVISPLADNKVPVLVISTYQSDYVLVSFQQLCAILGQIQLGEAQIYTDCLYKL